MASFEDKLASFENKIDLLNQKMDKILLLLEKPNKQSETTWSISDYNIKGIDYFLISFSFNTSFKEYVKEIGGLWNSSRKAWMFPKSNQENIVSQISTRFPNWSLI
jgi:hypothetical protein